MAATQKEIAAAEEAARLAKTAGIEKGREDPSINGMVQGIREGDNSVENKSTYHSPGAADIGGYAGGAKDISDTYKYGSHTNDAAQARNSAALGDSIKNMTERRGDVSPENATLLAREAAGRAEQGRSLDLQRDAALGNAPSAAAYKTQMDMNNVAGAQAGALGSARGLSALGGGQTMGAAGAGQAGTDVAMMGGMGRSKEVGDAIGMYGSSAGDMRSGDLNRLAQSSKNAIGNMNLNDAWQVGNANLGVKQGNLGVAQGQMDDAWYQGSIEPYMKQLENNQSMNAIEAGAGLDAAAAIRAKANARRDANRDLAKGAVTAGLTAGGTMIGGPAGGAVGGMGGSYLNSKY